MISQLRREDESTLDVLRRSASELTVVDRIAIGIVDPPSEDMDLSQCARASGLPPQFVAARVGALLGR